MSHTTYIITIGYSLLVLVGYCYLLRKNHKNIRKLIFLGVGAVTLNVLPMAFLGKPFYWDVTSLIGKSLAAFIAFSLPFIISSIIFLLSQKKFRPATALIIAFIGGSLVLLPIIPVMPERGISVVVFAAVILTCGFTGDCL